MTAVTTWYLEMTDPQELRPKASPGGLEVVEAEHKEYRFNRFLYQLVGESWQWTDRLAQSDAEWQAEVESDDLRTWVAYARGGIAGYYELQRQDGGNVEIRYFGLAPRFLDQGIGGFLLSHALRSAWDWDAAVKRVWVHTCSHDHPSALRNYQARGMRLYHSEVSEEG